MLTYGDVQRIYRLEKNSTTLQKIPDSFYQDLKELLTQVGEDHKSYLNKLSTEIQEKRKNKLLIMSMRGRENPENAIPAEKELYDQIIQLLQNYEKSLFSHQEIVPIKEEKEVDIPEKTESNEITVKILTSLPEIMGPDSKTYGPFSQNSEVTLPQEVADILLRREVAERV